MMGDIANKEKFSPWMQFIIDHPGAERGIFL